LENEIVLCVAGSSAPPKKFDSRVGEDFVIIGGKRNIKKQARGDNDLIGGVLMESAGKLRGKHGYFWFQWKPIYS
jgi:hypothetical protein